MRQDHVDKLVKGADGISTLTTEPLPPDMYSYWFIVNGVWMPDPSNGFLKPGARTQQSMFAVPGPDEAVLEPGSVPHGEVRIDYFQSPVFGKLSRMYVYVPPGYEKGNTRYPVAYLFHGGGDDDWGWYAVGQVNVILDNLIAQGKAKPMILVMPSLRAGPTSQTGTGNAGTETDNTQSRTASVPGAVSKTTEDSYALFSKGFVHDIIPFVESRYRTLPGTANRAAGGLGQGREFMPTFLMGTIDNFDYAFFASGGASQERLWYLQKLFPGVIDKPTNIKRVKLFFGDGINDSSIDDSRYLSNEFKSRGYNVTRFENNGTHGWPSFRRNFVAWVQVVFR